MHKALVIVPILGWLGVGALLHQTREWPVSKLEQPTVVLLPPRPVPSAAAPRANLPNPADRAGLARELQKELKRVGCYDGDLNGAWTAATRQAMRRFTERVNAKLPLEHPDLILLKLVQSHPANVCSSGSVKAPADEEPAQNSTPLIIGAAASATAAATALSRSEPAAPAARPTPAPAPLTEDDPRQPRSARQSGPTPPAGLYQPRPQSTARRAGERPPVVVQSLVRNMQRALDSLGIR